MFLLKLRTFVAVAVVAFVGAGVVGLAFRAAGQDRVAGDPAPAEKRAEARPLTDLELLRREVDILKLQVEVLQEKMRLQEAELRALKGKAGGQPSGGASPPAGVTDAPGADRGGTSLPGRPGSRSGPVVDTGQEAGAPLRPTTGGSNEPLNKPDDVIRSGSVFRGKAPDMPGRAGDPLAEAEAALKKLREHPDDKQAADALERALRRLQEQKKPEAQPGSPAKP